MTYKITIPFNLPTLNEYINEERIHRQRGATLKRDTEAQISLFMRNIPKVDEPVIIHYLWVEKNRKKDKDNVAFAKKFIQDALVRCGILKNDGWNNIISFTDSFAVGKPQVQIIIEEVE